MESEKIVYELEVKTANAQKALKDVQESLPKEFKAGLNLSITGMEDFKTLQARLNECRKAIQYVTETGNNVHFDKNGTYTKEVTAGINALRGYEKALEDLINTSNKGNLNNLSKEHTKLTNQLKTIDEKATSIWDRYSESLERAKAVSRTSFNKMKRDMDELVLKKNEINKKLGKDIPYQSPLDNISYADYKNKILEIYKQLPSTIEKTRKETQKLINDTIQFDNKLVSLGRSFNRSFTNKTAWSFDKIASQYDVAQDLVNKMNKLYSQLELPERAKNPIPYFNTREDYLKNYFSNTEENKLKLAKEQVIKEKEAKKIEVAKQKLQDEAKQLEKQLNNLGDSFQRSFTNKTAWSFDKIANQYTKAKDLIEKVNKLYSELNVPQKTQNPIPYFNTREDYHKGYYANTEVYAQKLATAKQKQKDKEKKRIETNDLLLAKSEEIQTQKVIKEAEAKQKLQEVTTAKNYKALDQYWDNEEKRIKQNSIALKKAYEEWNKEETDKEKKLEKINELTQRYNNILNEANKKQSLGISLSDNDYDKLVNRLQNAKKKIVKAGGSTDELPSVVDKNNFNQKAVSNYFGGLNSKFMEAIQYSTSYKEQMSKLLGVLDSATYAWEKSGRTNMQAKNTMIQAEQAITKTNKALRQLDVQSKKSLTTLDKMFAGLRTHTTWIASSVAMSIPLVLPAYAINTIKDIESAFATVEQVMPEIEKAHKASLDMSLSNEDRIKGQQKVNDEMNVFIDIARRYGEAVDEVIEAGASIGRMYGQGENGITNTNLLAKQAARISVADNFPMLQATKGLESALSQFGLQTENTNQLLINSNRIIDVWTIAAHNGAASANDLTQGVQQAGAAAHQAGVSFEFLNALIATGVRNTGKSGNEIGTSIKSFLNSMQSDKSIKALQDFGINVYKDNGDGTKSMRSMESVILDVSRMLTTTEKNASNLLLTLSGGKFQVSKLTAILKDYRELVRMSSLLNSQKVTGFTDEQIQIQMDTLSRKLQGLQSNIQGLFVDEGNNGGLSLLKDITSYINNIVTGIRILDSSWGDWVTDITVALVALKGLPIALNKTAEVYGRIKGAMNQPIGNNTNTVNYIKNAWGLHLQNRYEKGYAQTSTGQVNVDLINQEKEVKESATKASKDKANAEEKEVKVSSNLNVVEKQKQVALVGSTAKTKVLTVATKAQSVANTVLTNTTRVASVVTAAFGGVVGLAITALSVIVPLALEYSESLGETKNAQDELNQKFEEELALLDEKYNRQIRAIDIAQELAEQYNALKDYIDNNTLSQEEHDEAIKNANATLEALKVSLQSAGVSEDEFGQLVDENGKIITTSFKNVKAESAKTTKAKIDNDISQLQSEKTKTQATLDNIKTRISGYQEEAKALGVFQTMYWKISRAIWKSRQESYDDLTNRTQKYLAENREKLSQHDINLLEERIATSKERADKAQSEYISESATLGDLSDVNQTIEGLQANIEAINTKISTLNAKSAELQTEINTGKYNTGNADNTSPSGIITENRDKEKNTATKSKAEKDEEKRQKQQAEFNKKVNYAKIISESVGKQYANRQTDFTNAYNTILENVERPDMFSYAQMAADKLSRPDLAKHIYAQWALESNRFKNETAIKNNNYAGLFGGASGRQFDTMEDFVNSYVDDFLSHYDLSNVTTGLDFAKVLKANGYFTSDANIYGNALNSIMGEMSDVSDFTEGIKSASYKQAQNWANKAIELGTIYGENGCTQFVKDFLQQANSPLADKMSLWTPDLLKQSKDSFNNFKSPNNYVPKAGDIVFIETDGSWDEPDHVVISDGKGGYYGNSSSKRRPVHGNLEQDFGLAKVWGYVATNTSDSGKNNPMLANSVAFVRDILAQLDIDKDLLQSLPNSITGIEKWTEAKGGNVRYDQREPQKGDILYTKDNKAYVVNKTGGYYGAGEKGSDWHSLKDRLTSTYTVPEYVADITLKNAQSKNLKIPEKYDNFLKNYGINQDDNALEKFQEDYSEKTKKYNAFKNTVSYRRSIFGEFDVDTANIEMESVQDFYNTQEKNLKFFTNAKNILEEKLNSLFGSSDLQEVLEKNGYSSWKELSSKQLNGILQGYSDAIEDKSIVSLAEQFKSASDNVDELNQNLLQTTQELNKLKAVRNIKDETEYLISNIDKKAELWKAQYYQNNGTYDGIEWRGNKLEYQDTIKKINLLKRELEVLNEEKVKAMAFSSKNQENIDKINEQIDSIELNLAQLTKKAQDTKDKLTRENKETISEMLHDLIKGGMSFKELWTNFWDNIAKIALDRIVGIADSTNPYWNLVQNMFGLGKPKRYSPTNTAAVNNTNKTVDYFSNQNPATSIATDVGTNMAVNYFDKQNTQDNKAGQLQLDAAKTQSQSALLNQGISITDKALSITDSSNTTLESANVATFGTSVAQFALSVAQFSMNSNTGMLAGLAGAKTGGQISTFKFGGAIPRFKLGGNTINNGGKIKGAGSGTSDSILSYMADQNKFIAVSNGEFIMNAKATSKYRAILEAMNLDKFKDGGMISPEPYVPILKNSMTTDSMTKNEARKQIGNERLESIMLQQNGILTNISKKDSGGGNVTVLQTRASSEEVLTAIAQNPRAFQKIMGDNSRRGFR